MLKKTFITLFFNTLTQLANDVQLANYLHKKTFHFIGRFVYKIYKYRFLIMSQ